VTFFLLSAATLLLRHNRAPIVIIFRWQMLIRLAAVVSAYKGPDATQTTCHSFHRELTFHNFKQHLTTNLRRIVSKLLITCNTSQCHLLLTVRTLCQWRTQQSQKPDSGLFSPTTALPLLTRPSLKTSHVHQHRTLAMALKRINKELTDLGR
jgi:hypothetical protein